MFLLFLFFVAASAFVVYDNLQDSRKFTHELRTIFMSEDHSNRQPNQQPNEWTNLTFNIPFTATSMQFIAYRYSPAEISYYSVNEYADEVHVSVVWWYKPWNLTVGWA